MNTLFVMSLTGAVMILIIAGLRLLLQNRLHRTVILLLWAVAAFRLMVPVVIPSSASVYNYMPSSEAVQLRLETVPDSYLPVLDMRPEVVTEEAPVYIPEGEIVVPEPVSEPSYDRLMLWVWGIGCSLCTLYFLWIHVQARLRYRFALPEEAPSYLGKIRLKRLDTIPAPLVYGFFRPVILLPSGFPKKDSPEYEQVLYHEMTHVRSGDLWIKLLMLVITAVHWFNPCVWLMLHLVSQDLELRCDARVIRKLGGKKQYAMALVQAEVGKNHHFVEASFAFSLTELRLNAIAKAKVYLPRSIIVCVVLSTVLLLCFATGPKANELEETESQEPSSASAMYLHREPICETYAEIIEPTTKPSPTIYVDEEAELEYLMSCDFEEYGSIVELSLKEGTYKTLALKLPDYTVFSVDPDGRELLTLGGEYSAEEERYYLTVRALDDGETVIYASVAGRLWMKIQVEISFDLYYSIPDADRFETYGSSQSITLCKEDPKTVRLKLPERATYVYDLRQNGNSISYSYLSVYDWYDSASGSLCLQLSTQLLTGDATIYFYIDGVYWCKLNVSIFWNTSSYNSQPAYNSGGYNYNSNSNDTYEYLYQLQQQSGPKPINPGYVNYGGSYRGPIHVYSLIVTNNGKVITPGIYYP